MGDYAYIDIILTVLAVLLTVRGFTRGFIKEFFSLGAFAFGIFGAFLFYKNGADYLREKYFENLNGIPEVLAFAAIFLIIFIICKLLQKVLLDVIKGLNLTSLDKMLGGIMGVIEGIAAVALVIFLISIQPLFNPDDLLQNSLFGKMLLPFLSQPLNLKEGLDGYTKGTTTFLLNFIKNSG